MSCEKIEKYDEKATSSYFKGLFEKDSTRKEFINLISANLK